MTTGPELLRMEGITKRFPGVLANDQISLDLRAGEIHALLGENGAGKSTLMKILYGLYTQDSGSFWIDGKPVEINSPRAAVQHGIGMVHQHFMLVPNLTAVENAVLGMKPEKPPFLDLDSARARLEELAAEYQLDVDPMSPVWQMPVGAQQRLEILKALFREAKILVLDEPSAVLAPAEVTQLFRILRRLADEGRGIIFISHKLSEVKEISDRITVLRTGRVIGTVPTEEAEPADLAHMMVGRPVSLDRVGPAVTGGKPVLVVDRVSCLTDRKTPALHEVSLTIRAGEIVGVAGVDGNGQRELVECIAGLRAPSGGSIHINNVEVNEVIRDPKLLGFIPEDRRRTGLVLTFSVAENLILKTHGQGHYKKRGLLNWNTVTEHALDVIRRFDVRCPGPNSPVMHLSGGNQQKVVVARETEANPAVLLASQPTRGLDIGAVSGVLDLLRAQRDQGAAVLFVSTELNEVLAVSDRIIILHKGEIMGEVPPDLDRIGQIGEMMMGRRQEQLAGIGEPAS